MIFSTTWNDFPNKKGIFVIFSSYIGSLEIFPSSKDWPFMAVRRKSSLFWISVNRVETPLVERSYQIHLLFVLKTPQPLLRLPAFVSHASRTHFPILPAIDDRRWPNQSHIKSNNRLVWHSVEKWLKKRRKSTHTQNMLKCHSIDDYRIDLRLIQNYNDRISIGSPRKCCTRPHFSFITCIML